mmetsp:Transcript_24396/g.67812  ORF Transcript_24396/g.67812 Transcript_24396/m.67812 type:complete len:346 (+) Transcript_24396:862-1899(+)|eukprot:CAMPEP_0117669390 /NCGR_PEP_ID=MMETSP0804-20121206/12107_1 /TAXON_ID=1074897 /ORGANISM="Tetraselmis astigmatica, Strain CCMP880" /LENGTH=345 /DNA_ID=CAMNT_0005477445 /DNA_START=841 /DNA_END=1878 /DNA_ORIENTATION=-
MASEEPADAKPEGQSPHSDAAESSEGEHGAEEGAAPATAPDDANAVPVKNRPRRKATEKPAGPDAVRQSFSKRKKGLAAKAYQLNGLTGAKVAVFVVNEKGSSWAYATPGFGAAVSPQYLSLMRKLAGLPSSSKLATDVMSHPSDDHATDDRDHWKTTTHPALTEPTHLGQPLYKMPHSPMTGPGMVAMLHPGFPTPSQAVGHPTAHISFAPPPPNSASEAPAADTPPPVSSAPRGGFAGASNSAFSPGSAVEAGAQAATSPRTVAAAPSERDGSGRSKGSKRAAEGPLAGRSNDEAASNPSSTREAEVTEKPRMMLTRQPAILPAEAPPPEGILPKRRRIPGQS